MAEAPLFSLYLDDTGSPKPSRDDTAIFFGLGGALVTPETEAIARAKHKWMTDKWKIDYPFHAADIRSKKEKFAWLGDLEPEPYAEFMNDLTNMIVESRILLHACIVDRKGYLNRYHELYGEKTWEMMKSALNIVVERAAKYVASKGGRLMVYIERSGKVEDRLAKSYYYELRDKGHPFDPKNAGKYKPLETSDLGRTLIGFDFKAKSSPMIQFADLCILPIAQGKRNPSNRAFQCYRENNLLIDCVLDPAVVNQVGIKYYCFDDTQKTATAP